MQTGVGMFLQPRQHIVNYGQHIDEYNRCLILPFRATELSDTTTSVWPVCLSQFENMLEYSDLISLGGIENLYVLE